MIRINLLRFPSALPQKAQRSMKYKPQPIRNIPNLASVTKSEQLSHQAVELYRSVLAYAANCSPCTLEKSICIDLLLLIVRRDQLSESICDYLASQKNDEVNLGFEDEYQIAFLTVLYAARGYSHPHVIASYETLGLHPDRVYQAIKDRRRALLGTLYDEMYPEQEAGLLTGPTPTALPPRKAPQSVKSEKDAA